MDIREHIVAERAELIELLRSLTPAQWAAPSLCEGWSVRDVAGHLTIDALPLHRYALAGLLHPSADHLVHQQDIRIPLGLPRRIDPDRLRLVLDHPDPFARPRRYIRELRLIATDLEWERGEGPLVQGPGEALALAMVGRAAVLDELDGDGVELLRLRIGRS